MGSLGSSIIQGCGSLPSFLCEQGRMGGKGGRPFFLSRVLDIFRVAKASCNSACFMAFSSSFCFFRSATIASRCSRLAMTSGRV